MDHVHITVKACIYIGFNRACEPAYIRLKTEFFNGSNGLFFGDGRCRKSCFDHMNADCRELAGDLKFLFKGECYPRGLFSIPECSIKNRDFITGVAFGEEGNPPQNPCEP